MLRESLAHGLFSGLFVCNARVSCTIFSLDCLFVTQEFRALFFLLDSLSFSRTNLFFNGLEFCTLICFKFACRLRKNLAHSFFPGFVCSLHKNIAHCFFCSFACLLLKNLAHSFFPRCVCSLHKNLVHCFFTDLLVCYARILCIPSPEVCLSVTQESCAQFLPLVCWSVMQESRALFCSDLLVCYARMSCFVSSIDYARILRTVCFSVRQEPRLQFLPWFCFSVVLEHCALFLL